MFEEFKRIGSFLWWERLIDSHGGNMSLKLNDKIYFTRPGVMLGDLKEGDIIEVGLAPGENEAQAGPGLLIHRAIYRETGAAAIVHAHPAMAIAVSLTDNKIIPQDAEGLSSYRSAAIVRAHQSSGSEEAARLLPSFLKAPNVIAVVKGHGSFAVGKTLEEAYRYTSLLENSCRVLVAVRSSGGVRPTSAPPIKERHERRSAIPPGIGVMDRSRYHKR